MGVLPVQCIVLRTRTEYISNDGDGLCAKSSSSWGLNEVTLTQSGFHEVYLVQRVHKVFDNHYIIINITSNNRTDYHIQPHGHTAHR